MESNKCKFELKAIKQKQLRKIMKKLKKKNTAGIDGLSQEKLIMGINSLLAPLTAIINRLYWAKLLDTSKRDMVATRLTSG